MFAVGRYKIMRWYLKKVGLFENETIVLETSQEVSLRMWLCNLFEPTLYSIAAGQVAHHIMMLERTSLFILFPCSLLKGQFITKSVEHIDLLPAVLLMRPHCFSARCRDVLNIKMTTRNFLSVHETISLSL